MDRLIENCKVVVANANAAVATAGAAAATEVNATGYDKALFLAHIKNTAGATLNSATFEIQQAGTTGGTYAVTTATGTIGTSGQGKVLAIDFTVAGDKPFLKLRGTAGSTGSGTIVVAAVCVLYRGSGSYPKAQDLAATLA